MTTAVLTSKGQVTIPKEVRNRLNVDSDDRVEFVEIEPGVFTLVAATRDVRELKGHPFADRSPSVRQLLAMRRPSPDR